MKPLVSIIIPTYNRLDLLKQAIASVISQTYSNYQIIIIDDGSTDRTTEYITEIGIKLIQVKHSGKPGYVRNQGVKVSNGEYIAFLDSDDLWKPQKLEKQINYFLQNPGIQICHTKEIWIRNNKIISQKKQHYKRSGNIFQDALKKCIIGPSTVMIKKDLFTHVGMFNPELEIAEDYELWLRITSENPVGYIDEALVIKRGGHKDQLSMKYGHIELFRIKALLLNIKGGRLSNEQMRYAVKELKLKCSIYANGCHKRGKNSEYNKYMKLARNCEKTLSAAHS